jgi:hypothetical protein
MLDDESSEPDFAAIIKQTVYELAARTDSGWQTERVESTERICVLSAQSPLRRAQEWRVRVWFDGQTAPSAWSEVVEMPALADESNVLSVVNLSPSGFIPLLFQQQRLKFSWQLQCEGCVNGLDLTGYQILLFTVDNTTLPIFDTGLKTTNRSHPRTSHQAELDDMHALAPDTMYHWKLHTFRADGTMSAEGSAMFHTALQEGQVS